MKQTERFAPINADFPHFLHGGDYNPDQWVETPEIWDEDMRLMKLANCNEMSMGIFAWAALEPEEGVYDFSFLDTMMNKIARAGGKVVLATPSGAKPNWMAAKYPEIRRVNEYQQRELQGLRHNHCFTSPIYREKVQQINRKLAERYKDHPALVAWHISNEYGGECHCPLCAAAFREWMKNKYHGSLDELNHEYWSRFWSHTYTDWDQVEPPSAIGENNMPSLILDWKRFVTCQTVDFMKNEIAPLKEITPNVPITTNMMGTYPGLDYSKFKDVCDVVSWDNYPSWHGPEHDMKNGLKAREDQEYLTPSDIAFTHDMTRGWKQGKPFMLMESTPSAVNWKPVNKLKRPGMHILSSMQAVAHGSDTVQYFQWRKSRGGSEKFHGAVVDHVGHENTRVFREVSELGGMLKKLDDVIGCCTPSDVGLIWDQENRWAVELIQGFNKEHMDVERTAKDFHREFWKRGINVDVIDSEESFEGYKLIVAPMLYMMKPGVAVRLKKFVEEGGTLVTTYLTAMVNENDLCFLGGQPGDGMGEVLGLWQEDVDALYEDERVKVAGVPDWGNDRAVVAQKFEAKDMCALIHPTTAKVRAVYESEFYKGMAAATVNSFGKGQAWFIACRSSELNEAVLTELVEKLDIHRNLKAELPKGTTVSSRSDGEYEYLFVQNYNEEPVTVKLNDKTYLDMISGEEYKAYFKGIGFPLEVPGYGVKILKAKL